MSNDQSNHNPFQQDGFHRDPPPIYLNYPVDRSGRRPDDYTILQNVSPADKARPSRIADQNDRSQGRQPYNELSRNDQHSRHSHRANPSTSVPSRHVSGGTNTSQNRQNGGNHQGNYIYGAGAGDSTRDDHNRVPKQYTQLWYCHINCKEPGPWNVELTTQCIGCGHNRCERCQSEIAVTRDPQPPRR